MSRKNRKKNNDSNANEGALNSTNEASDIDTEKSVEDIVIEKEIGSADDIPALEDSSPVVFNAISDNAEEFIQEEEIPVYESSDAGLYYEESDDIADYAEDELYEAAEDEVYSEEYYPDEFAQEDVEYTLNRDTSFGGFVKEFFHHIGELIGKNKVIFAAILAVAVISFIIVVVINSNSRDAISSLSDNELGSASINSAMFIPQDPYEENAYPAINELVTKYLTAKQEGDITTVRRVRNYISTSEEIKIQVLSQYIDSYQNINCYTKIGPYENSYVVYVYCELKLKDYDVLSPYLITLLVCSNDDGTMFIYSGDFDSHVASYIYEISSQDDVKDLFNRVDTEYADILANNPEFAEYKTTMKDLVKEEVAAKLAEVAVVSENEAEQSVSEDQIEEANENETVEEAPFEVRATTTVNIRVSDSEDADKLDMLSSGSVVTCNAQQPNGWSEIVFNGQTGYVKSEYLERVDAGNDNAATNGTTVRCNDTVNIRESASTNADSLGVAYVGDTFTLVEELSNGWSKILYNGQEAYVKSEFLE